MKRITLFTICLILGVTSAQAQAIYSQSKAETNFRNTLWFNTENSAALTFKPLDKYSDLRLGVKADEGEFRRQTEANSSKAIGVATSGNSHIGKFNIWGEFSFNNIFEKDLANNAILFEVPEDFPYYLADTVSSRWNKQVYDMRTRISSPVLWDGFSFGLEVGYNSKVGAKQRDPRTTTYKYAVDVTPSAAWKISDAHMLGLNGYYSKSFERSEPSNVDGRYNQKVYLSRGLGMATAGTVGGNNGLGVFYFKGLDYGAGVQYNYTSGFDILAELGYKNRKMDVYEQPTLPKRRGTTKGSVIDGRIQVLFGDNNSDKVDVKAHYRTTDGYEQEQTYIQESKNQHWLTIADNKMSTYSRISLNAEYGHQFGAGNPDGYTYEAGARVAYDLEQDSYLIPSTEWNWSTVLPEAFGGLQWSKGRNILLVQASAGYGLNLSGDYIYYAVPGSVTDKTAEIYSKDMAFRQSSFFKSSVRASYTLRSKKVNYVFDLKATGWAADETNRIIADFTFGILF